MKAWRCDCGTYVDGPVTRQPHAPQPRPGNVELEGELVGCFHCDPPLGDRVLASMLAAAAAARLEMKCSTWFEGDSHGRKTR